MKRDTFESLFIFNMFLIGILSFIVHCWAIWIALKTSLAAAALTTAFPFAAEIYWFMQMIKAQGMCGYVAINLALVALFVCTFIGALLYVWFENRR